MGQLIPKWPAGDAYGDWIPVDVALDYELADSAMCRWVDGFDLLASEPADNYANPWETLTLKGSTVVYIAVDRLHSIYQAGYDDHMVHVPTFAEKATEQMGAHEMWGTF